MLANQPSGSAEPLKRLDVISAFRKLSNKETTPVPIRKKTEVPLPEDPRNATGISEPETTTETLALGDNHPSPRNPLKEVVSPSPVWSDDWFQYWASSTPLGEGDPEEAEPPANNPTTVTTRTALTLPPGCPAVHAKQRWRRNGDGGASSTTQKPDVGYLGGLVDSVYPANEDTLNERIKKKIETPNAVGSSESRAVSPPKGLDPTIQVAWSTRQWAALAQKVDAGSTQVVTKSDNKPTWSPVAKMKVYDQYITVQLTTLLSGALDAISDAAYHIVSDQRMRSETFTDVADPVRDLTNTVLTGNSKTLSLKSPRGHPKFGKGDINGLKRAEKFPLITHASVDHLIDINTRKVMRCWNLTTQALKMLGPPVRLEAPPEACARSLS